MAAKTNEKVILRWQGNENMIEAKINQGRITIRNNQIFNTNCDIVGLKSGPYFGQVRGIIQDVRDIPQIARRLRLKKTDIPEVEVINSYCENNNFINADNNSFRLVIWIGKKNHEFSEDRENGGNYFIVSPLLLVNESSIFNTDKPADNKQKTKISESINLARYTQAVKTA